MFITWILWTIVVFWIGHKFGYTKAHYVVSQECERLGKFFVGKKVYECVKITDLEDKEFKGHIPPHPMPGNTQKTDSETKENKE